MTSIGSGERSSSTLSEAAVEKVIRDAGNRYMKQIARKALKPYQDKVTELEKKNASLRAQVTQYETSRKAHRKEVAGLEREVENLRARQPSRPAMSCGSSVSKRKASDTQCFVPQTRAEVQSQ